MTDLPRGLVPMMATAGPLPRDEDAYAFEIKWDGVRAITEIEAGGSIRMHSRNLNDITPRYPEVHGIAQAAGVAGVVLDGEVVAFDETGRPSFGRLQQRMHLGGARDVRQRMVDTPVVYLVFDVLWQDGESLMDRGYRERRDRLEQLALNGPAWRVGPSHAGAGTPLLQATRDQGLEGVVAKRIDSVYEPGRRSKAWVKVKNVRHQDVVIGGWIAGAGGRTGRIGALLTGVYEETDAGLILRYTGRVGTGFSDRALAEWAEWLAPLARDTSPFADPVPERTAHFVEPRFVGMVEFTEWTSGGTLRHPSFKGRRDDIAPESVRRD